MISRSQVRQFLAVVDAGNFTLAANRIHVAQPTLSMGIAELEKQLGTRLFIRERRRIRLTEAGNRLLPFARSIERDFRLAERTVAAMPIPVRPIRLGVLHSFATAHLEAALGGYSAAEPVELTEGSVQKLEQALTNRSIDLAITNLRDPSHDASARLLYSETYRMALPVHHPLAEHKLLTTSDVAGETMIARRSCEFLAETSRFFTNRGVRPPLSMRSVHEDRVMAMVRAGLGVTIAPESFARPGIAMVPLEGFSIERHVGIRFGSDWQAHYGTDHPLPESFARVCQGIWQHR